MQITEEKIRSLLEKKLVIDEDVLNSVAEGRVPEIDELEDEETEEEKNLSEEEKKKRREELVEEERKYLQDDIWYDIIQRYQNAWEWIASVPSFEYYVKRNGDTYILSNNKNLWQLETKECKETEFDQYGLVIEYKMSSQGISVTLIKGVSEMFAATLAQIQNGNDDGLSLLNMGDTDMSYELSFEDNYTIYVAVRDWKDIKNYSCYEDKERCKGYQNQAMYCFYGVLTAAFLFCCILFGTIGKEMLRSHKRPAVPTDAYLLLFLAAAIFSPRFLLARAFLTYFHPRNTLGTAGIYMILLMGAYQAYLVMRCQQNGLRNELRQATVIGRVYARYRRNKKWNMQGNQKTLLRNTIFWTLITIVLWYVGTYYFKHEHMLQTSCYYAAGIALFFIWFAYYVRWKNVKRIKDEENYQSILQYATSIADGKKGEPLNDDLGRYNELRDVINHIGAGMEKAVDEAVKSQSMKTELITNVSHDLKTPLTSIVSYVDLLKRKDLTDDEKREYVEILEQKSARLKTLIEDLFEMSKAASRDIKLQKTRLNIVALTKEVLVEHEPAMDERGLKVNMSYSLDEIRVDLDGQKTYRIISNLIGNITKYAMKGTRVYVTITKDRELVLLEFKNISATELTHQGEELVERFVREDKSRNTEGSGLGLAIAKSLTELQQGTFKVEADGDLFRVCVSFPLAEERSGEEEH